MAAMLCLTAGALVYLLFRPTTLLLFVLAGRAGCMPTVLRLRALAADVQLPDVVVSSLPGGLWSAAWVLLMSAVFSSQERPWRLFATGLIPAVGVLSEGAQALGLIGGTADISDALCYLLPWLTYLFVNGVSAMDNPL